MGSEEEKRFQLSYFLFFVSSGRLDHGGHARVHDRADVDVDGVRHDGARLRRPLHFLAAPIAVLQPSGLMFFVKKNNTKKRSNGAAPPITLTNSDEGFTPIGDTFHRKMSEWEAAVCGRHAVVYLRKGPAR